MEIVKKYGFIVSLSGDTAYVCIEDRNECLETCSKRGSCGIMKQDSKSDSVIEVKNTINAEKGQRVEISIADRKLSGYAFFLFILPLILISFGAITSYSITQNTIASFIVGGFGLLISIFINRKINKKAQKDWQIVRIIL